MLFRSWIFVLDHCDAILKILFKGKSGESYNISTNNEVNNITIVKKILKIMGKSDDLIEFISDRPGHDFRYSLNSNKIRRELSWKPTYRFDDGLEKTIDWYQHNKEWRKNISNKMLTTFWKTR